MMRRMWCVALLAVVLAGGSAQADLIGYWTFDDQAATTADRSASSNDGTVTNGVYVAGHTGQASDYAIDFNGSNAFVATGVSLISGVSPITTAGWVQFDAVGSRVGLWGQNDRFEFGPNSTDASLMAWTPVASVSTPAGSVAVDGTTWHHVATVHDGTGSRIYIDGALQGTGGAYSAGSSGYPWRIGGGGIWDTGGNWFNGRIDDVAVWNESLSAPTIEALATGHASPALWGPYDEMIRNDLPLGYWRLGETALPTATDQMGAHDGTYTGFAAADLGQSGAIRNDPDTAARFDASDNRVIISNSVLTGIGTGAFSVEMWLNKTQDGRGDPFNLKGTGGDFGIIFDGDEKLWLYWSGTAIPKGAELDLDTWYHMVITREADQTMNLFINGALYSTGASGNNISSIAADIWLGSNRSGSSPSIPFGGFLDEVALYGRALSRDEIMLHYQRGVPEPATLSLLALGGLALLRRRKRR